MEGRPSEQRELVVRARGGDERAFEELVRPHREIAFRLAYVITRDAADRGVDALKFCGDAG